MTPEQWAEVQRHFEALCDLPAEIRQHRLARLAVSEEVRAQIASLLDFDDTDALEAMAAGVRRLSGRVGAEDLVGECVGPWRLVRTLGEGGMGEVFLAERADGRYEATVAIKFLALGGSRAQYLFERERQVLARMTHPGIARLLDAGEHPRLGAYLVMEYVGGEPLDRLAGRLSVSAVLARMAQAARAVAFAHQNLVLHRDLKPDHLIVTTEGELKVLDFGVAALLEDGAAAAQLTGHDSFTPRYAAPEQILRQATTTRTDVYALGVVLYELLCGGVNPFGEAGEALIRRKLADRPRRLPRVAGLRPRQFRDLQAVIGRCIAADPTRRYASASELAADLEALLADHAVQARSPGLVEQLQRSLARHRLAAAAFVLALLAIGVGSTASLLFAWQAQRERDIAVAEANKARQITTFMESIFQTSAPGVDQGPETTARDLLDRGRERIAEELADQPQVAAHLQRAIASSYMFLGLHHEALSVLDEVLPDEPPESLARRDLLAARILLLQGRYAQALARLDAAKPELTDRLDRAQAALSRAMAEINLGQPEAARHSAGLVIELADDSDEGFSKRLGAQNLLGVIAYNRGDYEAARSAFKAIYQMQHQRHGEGHGATGMALLNLGGAAFSQGDLNAALSYYQRALAIQEQYYGVDNQSVAMVLHALGKTYHWLGDADSAEAALRRSMAAYEVYGGRERHYWRNALLALVELLVLTGRDEAAGALLAEMPIVAVDGPAHEQQVSCRLETLKKTLNLPAAECDGIVHGTDSVRAMSHYLEARNLHQQGNPDYLDEVAKARKILTVMTNPDPHLSAALNVLENGH